MNLIFTLKSNPTVMADLFLWIRNHVDYLKRVQVVREELSNYCAGKLRKGTWNEFRHHQTKQLAGYLIASAGSI